MLEPFIHLLGAALCAAPSPAGDRGSDPSPSEDETRRSYRTVVRPRPQSRRRALERKTPGFVSVVELDDPRAAPTRDGLAEVVARTPGAHVRSLGGLGQFSSVSLRGSTAQQVGVFLDGVPLSSSYAGLFDLADLPIEGLTRVEIHRGYVPIAFGAAALGGAIDLRAEADEDARPHVTGLVGFGSFLTRQARAGVVLVPRPRLAIGMRVAYGGTRGDFPYYDDGGTPTSTFDDRVRRRINAGYDRVLAQLRVDARRGAWRIGVQQLVTWKQQGIPGPAAAPARDATQNEVFARTTASIRRALGRPGGTLEWVLGLGVGHRRFRDPRAEIGVGNDDQSAVTIDAYVSPRWRVPLWRDAFLTVMADQRTEWLAIDQRVQRVPSGDAQRARAGFGAGAELEQFLWRGRAQIVPAVRVDGFVSRFAVASSRGEQDDEGKDSVTAAVSPRIGARLSPWPFVSLRGSFGRYLRVPSLVELFGDRGFFVGNEGLRPERGLAADGGVVLDVDRPRLAAYAQVAGFWSRSRDLIQWVSAGTVARPQNVAGARVRGLEASAQIRDGAGMAELVVHYTLLDAVDRSGDPARDGRALPGRPRHDLYVRGSFGRALALRGVAVEPRIAYTVEVVAHTFLDPSERYVLPPRLLQGLGVELHVAARVHAGIEIRNLLDVRTATVTLPTAGDRPSAVPIADFIGYPLPGRSLWATLRLDFDLPRRAAA
ncbi:MAG TPA: TonB-dependent receptor [Nannocystaceae bacterium]|nr:TonB-dependent receptor [Nannocystaceae bacterium]